MHRSTRLRVAGAMLLTGLVASGCRGDDRPTVDDWQPVWEARQALIPDAAQIASEGEALCGERLGTVRTEFPALRPTPAEALDTAVDDWIAHAETLLFECPDDPSDLERRFDVLTGLAAEVDAGVASTRGN
jgi:hypothetical protein